MSRWTSFSSVHFPHSYPLPHSLPSYTITFIESDNCTYLGLQDEASDTCFTVEWARQANSCLSFFSHHLFVMRTIQIYSFRYVEILSVFPVVAATLLCSGRLEHSSPIRTWLPWTGIDSLAHSSPSFLGNRHLDSLFFRLLTEVRSFNVYLFIYSVMLATLVLFHVRVESFWRLSDVPL